MNEEKIKKKLVHIRYKIKFVMFIFTNLNHFKYLYFILFISNTEIICLKNQTLINNEF